MGSRAGGTRSGRRPSRRTTASAVRLRGQTGEQADRRRLPYDRCGQRITGVGPPHRANSPVSPRGYGSAVLGRSVPRLYLKGPTGESAGGNEGLDQPVTVPAAPAAAGPPSPPPSAAPPAPPSPAPLAGPAIPPRS